MAGERLTRSENSPIQYPTGLESERLARVDFYLGQKQPPEVSIARTLIHEGAETMVDFLSHQLHPQTRLKEAHAMFRGYVIVSGVVVKAFEERQSEIEKEQLSPNIIEDSFGGFRFWLDRSEVNEALVDMYCAAPTPQEGVATLTKQIEAEVAEDGVGIEDRTFLEAVRRAGARFTDYWETIQTPLADIPLEEFKPLFPASASESRLPSPKR